MSLQMAGSNSMRGHPACILDYARDYARDYAWPDL